MAGTEYSDFGDYTVFTGSTDHDVMCRKNYLRQELEDLRTEYFLLEAQRVQAMEQRSIYLEKAKRREEIIALLKKQREERMKKELVSYGHKPNIQVEERRLATADMEELEDKKGVRQLV
ncbi:cilia- and flagella-associated protein HOATZ isoform 3-T5 [Anomaloglossus baeobatrachus]|uniref:cilia- and flagella-associated protein HOATZ isoform X3 n=1 Tax=Anomaloglossus baeobatrachus TaxID=238106 RepID=UPI003F4FF524